ncbi:hypothetical protein EYC84_003547 [Monilinia fructicola]|uniref:Uncharacterized protein n=1 Tax=Monilinia fructicola TaxID=38448 RepID=A0A5M9JX05_MONFR|nr:hypothetical protein EYC84_003547 [Monilinia fructicola]
MASMQKKNKKNAEDFKPVIDHQGHVKTEKVWTEERKAFRGHDRLPPMPPSKPSPRKPKEIADRKHPILPHAPNTG